MAHALSCRILLLAGLVFVFSGGEVCADTVVLKNGHRFEGRVTAESDSAVVLETATGEISFKRADIAEIVRATWEPPAKKDGAKEPARKPAAKKDCPKPGAKAAPARKPAKSAEPARPPAKKPGAQGGAKSGARPTDKRSRTPPAGPDGSKPPGDG